MASRLSEESLKAVLDAGHQALAIQFDGALAALTEPDVDLDALLNAEDPEAAVQAIAPQRLHRALIQRGPEDCLEVLPLLSEEQVTRIFDYEAWTRDQLEPLKAIKWLNLFKEVSTEELYKRFRGLEEEFQLALLSPLIDLVDEEVFEKLSDEEQDQFNRLPCSTLFYKIKSHDPRIDEFVLGLVEASLAGDVAYAYSLLAHAAYIPPSEQEAMLTQFRRARLEEDGFVTYAESLKAFEPVDVQVLRHKWGGSRHRETAAVAAHQGSGSETPFLAKVLAASGDWQASADATSVLQGLAFLGNSLCAVAQIEPDDHRGLKRLLQQAQAMVSLSLDFLTGGDVEAAKNVLKTEHPQVLFRCGLMLVRQLGEAVLERFAAHGLPNADKLHRQLALGKRGVLELTLERTFSLLLGFERVETLKGLFNRFPLRPVAVDEDERGGKRVTFKPIASMQQLAMLAAAADQITGLLALAALADDDKHSTTWSLDRRISTGLARVLLGEEFRALPLTAAELDRLAALPIEAAQAIMGDFFTGAETSLRQALTSDELSEQWSASSRAGIYVADPLQGVMADLADLALGISVAREHVRQYGARGVHELIAVNSAPSQEVQA